MIQRELAGKPYLDAITALIQTIRARDHTAGLYEVGDLHWWWATEPELAGHRATFWFHDATTELNASLAAFLVAELPRGDDDMVEFECDLIVRPDLDPAAHESIFSAVGDRLDELHGAQSATSRTKVVVPVRDDDGPLRDLLKSRGFSHDPAADVMQMVIDPVTVPSPCSPPEGFVFADDRTRHADNMHHLVTRNGPLVRQRLADSTIYRPDLDLSVQTLTGEVVAYCLCWYHPESGIGLFEPVRTEDAYQRLGLGRALMTEGIRRLTALSATSLKISVLARNEPAVNLYTGVGFRPLHRGQYFIWPSGASR